MRSSVGATKCVALAHACQVPLLRWLRRVQAVVAGQVSVGMAEMTGGAAQALDLTSEQSQIDIADGSLWARVKEYYDLVRGAAVSPRLLCSGVDMGSSCLQGYLLGAGSPAGDDATMSDQNIVQVNDSQLLSA